MNWRKLTTWLVVLLVLVGIGGAAYYALLPQLQPHVTVHLGDGVFAAKVANTEVAREKGLGGTLNLRNDQAMLFVFDNDSKWPIWMKDMNYPIDIVWLDSNKKVVYIVKNAPPESYPYEQFTPKENARYVVELSAGTVSQKSIDIGITAAFDENNVEGWHL